MPTRLEAFLRTLGIKPVRLGREPGYSRQYLLLVRKGLATPSARCKASILGGCRRLTRKRVRYGDLFDRDKRSTGSHLSEE